MKFSKKSEYALRALIELTAQYGQPHLQRHEIAKRQQIPIEFLEQILLTLKNAGLLGSRRGVTGGILDGPLAPISCVSKTAYQKCSDCPYTEKKSCPIQNAMLGVRNAIADILDNYKLSDFASGHCKRPHS